MHGHVNVCCWKFYDINLLILPFEISSIDIFQYPMFFKVPNPRNFIIIIHIYEGETEWK